MDRPKLPDRYRPIDPLWVELGMEVYILTYFPAGTMVATQGRVATYGITEDAVFFINLRGVPICLDRPYPHVAFVWEVLPEKEPVSTVRANIEKLFEEVAFEVRRML